MQRLTLELKLEADSGHLNMQLALRNFGIHHHNREELPKLTCILKRTRVYLKMWLGLGFFEILNTNS